MMELKGKQLRTYDYQTEWTKLLTPKIVRLVSQIHEDRGQQVLFIEAKADTLTQLMEIAKIQSTESSNKIEGIYTSDKRLRAIVHDKTRPRTRNEEEIAGYRDVLNTIHEDYDHIPLKSSIILQLHRDLYKFQVSGNAGRFKTADNVIEEEDSEGNTRVRFRTVPAWAVPEAIEELCCAFAREVEKETAEPLILIPMFVLDFLCIHPFLDGNGRMSRLLTLLLLYQSGYIVGKYISIERMIEATKEEYYESLRKSSDGWHENANDYEPFVRYMLEMIAAAYREFFSRVSFLSASGVSKPERIRRLLQENVGTITAAEILEKCPDISRVTVQRTLSELTGQGLVDKIGGGRYTRYVWKQ